MYSSNLRQLSSLIRSKIRENIINNNKNLYNNNNFHTIENCKHIVDTYNGDDWLIFKDFIDLHQPKLDKLYHKGLDNKNKMYYMNNNFYLEKKERDYYKLKLPYTDCNDIFNMYIIKWNPGSLSPIHNHPELGCIMRILEGDVLEKKYDHDINLETETLLSSDKNYDIDLKTTYIDDSQNYHSISNISYKPAYTLHAYGYKPFSKHKILNFNKSHKNNTQHEYNLLRYIMV